MGWRVLEWFSGVGGWRHALGARGEVVAAYDVSPVANATYELAFGDRPTPRELASLALDELRAHDADTWLLSPPCQPFCRAGDRRGLEDPRSRAFLRVLELLEQAPPRRLALENVEGFLGSEAHDRLEAVLLRLGLHTRTLRLCPTHFGIPNQRPRVFVVASMEPIPELFHETKPPGTLASYLDANEDSTLYLSKAEWLRHGPGLDLVRPWDCRSTCFIGGYGRKFVGSGSFLQTELGVRRFSPPEIARLMGLPPDFAFPAGVPLQKRYKLLGNGLSIPVTRWVLRHLQDGEGAGI